MLSPIKIFRSPLSAWIVAAAMVGCETKSETAHKTTVREADNHPPTVLPLVTVDGMPFVSVRTDSSGAHLWLIDSGFESSVVNARFVDSLPIPRHTTNQQAAPGGHTEVGRVPGISLHVGSVTFKPDSLDVIDLHNVEPLLGVPYAGILGHDFLLKYVTRIDYDKKQVELFAPDKFRYTGTGDVLPLWFEADQPFVFGVLYVGGRATPAKIKIDTGSLDELGLNGSFVEQTQLVGNKTHRVPAMGSAIGGKIEAFVIRLDSMKIGTMTLPGVIAGYSVSTERRGDAGTMGVGILGRFNLVFDYARRRLILEKTPRFADAASYDASGLLLATTADFRGITVRSVDAKSPAEAAGILAGDSVLSVDGISASELGLTAVRHRLTQTGNVTLRLVRKGQRRDVELHLKERL